MTADFDELNILGEKEITDKMRSLPYDVYFGEMQLTQEQKQRRIEMAEALEEDVFFILCLVDAMSVYSAVDWENIEERFREAYLNALGGSEGLDDYTLDYITQMSYDLTQSTRDGMATAYNVSYDRARYICENEANTLVNHFEDVEAVAAGYTQKTWVTMKDNKVRHTHVALDGKTIPIVNYFEVGDDLMSFPKDLSLFPSPDEYINCRCAVKYS